MFYLFQRVRDRLYLTPSPLDEHTSSTSAYLGALGFMKPLEKIVLRAIPLKEATRGRVPEKALVLAATKCTLYGEDPPSVGVGLVYKPHYVSMESFCRAYMHLNVWHAAASSKDSTDKLDHTRFILVSILEMREVMSDTLPHPLFLDVIDKGVVEETGEPLAPGWFRGFRLHTMWSQPPGKEPVHKIAFPRLRGDATTPMLEHEPEKLPAREAIMTTEGREVDPDQITQHVVHPALHQDCASDFRSQRATDIAPTLTSPYWWGSPAVCISPRGQQCLKDLRLPKHKRVCRVVGKLLFSQLYQAPHT